MGLGKSEDQSSNSPQVAESEVDNVEPVRLGSAPCREGCLQPRDTSVEEGASQQGSSARVLGETENDKKKRQAERDRQSSRVYKSIIVKTSNHSSTGKGELNKDITLVPEENLTHPIVGWKGQEREQSTDTALSVGNKINIHQLQSFVQLVERHICQNIQQINVSREFREKESNSFVVLLLSIHAVLDVNMNNEEWQQPILHKSDDKALESHIKAKGCDDASWSKTSKESTDPISLNGSEQRCPS